MRIKFITDKEVLLNEVFPVDMKDDDIKKITQFDKREILSYTIELIDGIKMGQAHSMDKIKTEWIKTIIAKIK